MFLFLDFLKVITDFKIEIFTLGVKEIWKHHTGENLKELILSCFKSFGIFPRHLYSITSDNGSNMIKMIQLIDELYCTVQYAQIEDDNSFFNEDELEDLVNEISGWIIESVRGEV